MINAFQYHEKTSYDRYKMSGHSLNWEDQPTVFKTYPGVTPNELPREVHFPEIQLSSLLRQEDPECVTSRTLSKTDLSRTLLLTYSLTAKARHPGGDFYYRSAASAGALYPTEIYLGSRGVDGVADGLYHFSIAHHGLALLRKGDFSDVVSDATQMPHSATPALTFFFSAIFFRSAWKYRDRAYRYHLLDTGHVIEHLFLALKSSGLPLNLSYDFDDEKINHLLGLDTSKEVCLAISQIRQASPSPEVKPKDIPTLPAHIKAAGRVSRNEVDYPAIREIHSAGIETVSAKAPVVEMTQEIGVSPRTWMHIEPPDAWPRAKNFDETVFRRRSRRNFVGHILPENCIQALLESLCIGDSKNASTDAGYESSLCTGFLTNRVEGFEPGFYLLDRASAAYGFIDRGIPMEKMAHICLDQMWLSNAGVHFLFMANLQRLDQTWGARGYRYAMMHAGRMGERLYLAAEALGLGACGIGALYDHEAAEALGLNHESRLLYLVAVGAVKGK